MLPLNLLHMDYLDRWGVGETERCGSLIMLRKSEKVEYIGARLLITPAINNVNYDASTQEQVLQAVGRRVERVARAPDQFGLASVTVLVAEVSHT